MNRNIVSQLETCEENAGAPALLRLTGNLCYESAREVVHAVSESLAKNTGGVEMDLSAVEILDSSGVRALLQCRRLCLQASVGFRLGSISGNVARVMSMSGFSDVFGLPRIDMDLVRAEEPCGDIEEITGWKVFEHVATSDPAVISILRDKVTEAAVGAGACGNVLCDIQIAVGEALTNAYRHGSPNKGMSKICLRYMLCQRAIVVEVQDEGKPFDPNAVPIPNPDHLREHGMGIYLMRQAMDHVEFISGCPGNRVRMVKWLEPVGDVLNATDQSR